MSTPIRLRTAIILCLLLLRPAVGAGQPSGATGNVPLPPDTLQRRLQDDPFDITAAKSAGGGVMGAEKLTVVFADDGFTTDVKWKQAPHGGDGWNNSPRRETAAYAFQKLYLDPDDYVVPPVAARCIGLDAYRPVSGDVEPNLDGNRCVFGALSAWLHNVKQPDPIIDMDRFSRDYRYAYHVGNLNLLTYLILHKDRQPGNFLMSTDPANPQMFSIDNGIAFGGVLFNFFTTHYDHIVVGGVPRQSIERLRRVTDADLDRLGVVGEMRADGTGVLRSVPPSPNADPTAGQRAVPGGIQYGLTADEIQAIAARLHDLIERVDQGAIAVF